MTCGLGGERAELEVALRRSAAASDTDSPILICLAASLTQAIFSGILLDQLPFRRTVQFTRNEAS
jgi:hypothetical protein